MEIRATTLEGLRVKAMLVKYEMRNNIEQRNDDQRVELAFNHSWETAAYRLIDDLLAVGRV